MEEEDLRKGEVAEQDLGDEDNRQRKYLFGDAVVKLEKAAASDTARAIAQPAQKCGDPGLCIRTPEPSTLRRNQNGWRNSSTESQSSQRAAEAARQAREADEQEVGEYELHIRARQRERESARQD